ncbi:MAG: nucleoside-diphosphate sugar epimerase/dehydratase [Bacteroidales bacterium]|nr:nucleoside-diphosphate sugar epimerase/dehydratase [Bacteroidales bacterium]
MANYFDRLAGKLSTFLDSRVIFILDCLLSIIASIFALLCLGYMRGTMYASGNFALLWLSSSLVATIVAMLIFKGHKLIIRHTSLHDVLVFVEEVAAKFAIMFVVMLVAYRQLYKGVMFALFADGFFTLFLLVFVRLAMIVVYNYFMKKRQTNRRCQRVLLFGTGDKSMAAVLRLQNSTHYKVVGFLTEEPQPSDLRLANLPVFSYQDDKQFKQKINDYDVDAVLFTSEVDAKQERDGLVKKCLDLNVKPLIIPNINEITGRMLHNTVRNVKIEDLLGREEIQISMDAIKANFQGKVVMVTGAAGSIGSELCRQLAGFGVKKLILFDNAETPMHNIRLELEEKFPDLTFVPVIGDVRQGPRVDFAFRAYRPQIVFHAAAYKHVPLMEENPCEAIRVNVHGTHTVADKCIEYDVEKMVMISTDKAVNPTNVMGCSKRIAEIYVQSLGLAIERGEIKGRTKFVTTRFGNVLGSNGSVIPRFREQIEKGGPITVTHPEITRFFMTIPEACRLVMEAATFSTGTQIFVFDMGESVKIDDLAKRMIDLAGLKLGEDIQIVYTGLRPGEKLYEEVLSNKENTTKTTHNRIYVAKVREYSYKEALEAVNEMEEHSIFVRIPEMVMKMKEFVPEFVSKNSVFEKYDKHEDK